MDFCGASGDSDSDTPEIASLAESQIVTSGGKSVRTADGRTVEYSVEGSNAPDAKIFVSAYVSNHLLRVPKKWPAAYERLKIRAITISLPGLGHSSLRPGGRISEWPHSDLEPILKAEGVAGPFTMWGMSYGTLYAMAVAQEFGPNRVQALGLRVPYVPLPVSDEYGLPVGQPELPCTEEVLADTLKVRLTRGGLGMVFSAFTAPGPAMRSLMQMGLLGAQGKAMMDFTSDFPEEAAYLNEGIKENMSMEATMYMMAKDVALDCPGLDPRRIDLPSDRIVVWYAADDSDCPPSHGEWLANHMQAKKRVFDGYGHPGGCLIDMDAFFETLARL
mmetsp:Transcript_38969/g.70943  ORF Transcript_38969/g.70943 Transcript_38969/m.70943 type:complete len:332 (-) Transcript_38969:44-1039(-)